MFACTQISDLTTLQAFLAGVSMDRGICGKRFCFCAMQNVQKHLVAVDHRFKIDAQGLYALTQAPIFVQSDRFKRRHRRTVLPRL
jgi:hypothetical protein